MEKLMAASELFPMFWENAQTRGPMFGKRLRVTFVRNGRTVVRLIDDVRTHFSWVDPETDSSPFGVRLVFKRETIATISPAAVIQVEEES